MKNKAIFLTNTDSLREKAENQLVKKSVKLKMPLTEANTIKLLHELQVHQIELEMQNKELVDAKEKAELAEERYVELYDFAPIGYLSLSEKGEITKINFAASNMLNKERSLLINQRFDLFLTAETRKVFLLSFRKIFSNHDKQTCEVTISNSENKTVYVLINCTLSQCGNFCFLTLTDISKRKQAELDLLESNKKIEESENRFLQLVQNIDECFWLRDDTTVLYISPGFEKIWGIPCQSLYDNPQVFTEFIHPDDKSMVQEILLSDKFKNSGLFDFEYRIIRKDKEIRWINAKSFPITDDNGVILRRAGIAIDITEKIQKQLELIKAKELAEESDLLKSAFLANMSHEIRTPMNGILGFSDLLKNPELTGTQQQEYIRIIEKSGKRLLNIINDIIDISKIEAGLMKPDFRESNINEQIEYIHTFFKTEAEAKGLTITFRCQLPAVESTIITDHEKVYAILTNLVKNAIKYSNKGSIEFGYSKKGKFLEFFIADEGIGIPAARLNAIFERFIQADIEDRNAMQGAGLGLAITKAYVTMLGGEIWVESKEAVGSAFYFTLPYITKQNDTKQKNDLVSVKKNNFNSNLKVLIVEDDEISRLLLETELKGICREILKTNSGLEAIKICMNHPDIDLVLMDIRMPDMFGYEAARQIRLFNNNIVIIAQTAYGLSGDREKAIESGFNDYLSKPIARKKLLAVIEKNFKV